MSINIGRPLGSPDIPKRAWENPFRPKTYLHTLFQAIVKDERDMVIIIDDLRGRRGTGKTTACIKFADGVTQSGAGFTRANASLDVEEIREAYYQLPYRTGIMIDEAEIGVSNRQAMTKTNQALREIMSMGRVEQKYVFINAPLKGFIDKDLLKLADVWITMTRKGRALVHQLKWEPYSERLMTPKMQWMNFNRIEPGSDLKDVYNYLTREKRKKIRGQDGQGFVTRAEFNEEVKKAREDGEKVGRDDIIYHLYTHAEIRDKKIPQRVFAEAADCSQKTISNIIRRLENRENGK